jgi:hypothetical protein
MDATITSNLNAQATILEYLSFIAGKEHPTQRAILLSTGATEALVEAILAGFEIRYTGRIVDGERQFVVVR